MSFKKSGRGMLGMFLALACTGGVLSRPLAAKALPSGLPPTAASRFQPSPRLLAFLLAAGPQTQAPEKPSKKADILLPEGSGKDTTQRVCGNCHTTDVWAKQRHTPEKWSSIIDNMVSKGMEASDDDLAVVQDYLNKNFAPLPKDGDAPKPPSGPLSK